MDDPDRISFLGGRCPENFRLRTVILQPGDALDYRPADWVGAFVVVERGELEIECHDGALARFQAGAVLVFAGLTPRCLRNSGGEALVLSVLSRDR
ncbi:MAG: hypothetical protein ACJ73S_01130 [Mycobacteriales bacterium]